MYTKKRSFLTRYWEACGFFGIAPRQTVKVCDARYLILAKFLLSPIWVLPIRWIAIPLVIPVIVVNNFAEITNAAQQPDYIKILLAAFGVFVFILSYAVAILHFVGFYLELKGLIDFGVRFTPRRDIARLVFEALVYVVVISLFISTLWQYDFTYIARDGLKVFAVSVLGVLIFYFSYRLILFVSEKIKRNETLCPTIDASGEETPTN